MEIRVTVFEDNPIMLDAYRAVLNGTEGFHCAGAYKDCNDWKYLIERTTPDVVLMDIELPGLDGIAATKLIHEQFPELRLLIQTVFDEDEKIFAALCAGAHGYVLKKTSPAQLLDAITEVYKGGSSFSPAIAAKIVQLFRQFAPPVIPVAYELTTREKQVLQLMTEGKSLPVIAKEIFLGYETVRSYVKTIYQKLHVASATEAVGKAIRERLV
ncbi:MAG: response regulator transcription factor [Chitinophagaceae bacterium]